MDSMRDCLGYDDVLQRSSVPRLHDEIAEREPGMPNTVQSCLQTIQLRRADVIYFDAFRYHINGRLVGFPDADRFLRAIVQLSEADELYLETALAIGALYRVAFARREYLEQLGSLPISMLRLQGSPLHSAHYKAAIAHHIKAVALFRSRIQDVSPERALEMPVTGSVALIFISFEQIQGNYDALYTMASHVQTFLRESIRQHKKLGIGYKSRPTGSEVAARAADLRHFEWAWPKTQINPLAAFLVGCNEDESIQSHIVPNPLFPDATDTFETVVMLCRCEIGQTDVFLREVFRAHRVQEQEAVVNTLIASKQLSLKFIDIHNQWIIHLEGRIQLESDTIKWRILKGLQIYCRLYATILSAVYDRFELGYDASVVIFESILKDVQNLLDLVPTDGGIPSGMFPIIWFILIKCRDHPVRTFALRTLERIEELEGSWATRLILQSYRTFIQLEEKSRDTSGRIAVEGRYTIVDISWDLDNGRLVTRVEKVVTKANVPESLTYSVS
jgi:hypothetical protein